uniref:Ubiquitin fusion degradation protein UFD1 N-terminal subdomain 1 domain-containing protein n=1 Tax=Zea mays TaxID=4577 RepID=A0A804LUD8_MAIZE
MTTAGLGVVASVASALLYIIDSGAGCSRRPSMRADPPSCMCVAWALPVFSDGQRRDLLLHHHRHKMALQRTLLHSELDRRKDQGSLLHKENVDEDSLWVIMLLSPFDQLGGLKIEYSMLFQIKNPNTERVTRCSVLEFVANEGFIHMPSRLMAHLGDLENEIVLLRST